MPSNVTLDQIEDLINIARQVDVLLDGLATLGIGSTLPPQYKEDWARIHTELQEILEEFPNETR